MGRHGGFLVQSNFGEVGHLELVVPSQLGGLTHSWRDNDDPSFTWHGSDYFGEGDVLAASLIQSTFGDNLEVVLRQGTALAHCYRSLSAKGAPVWSVPTPFASGVAGNPSLVQAPGPVNLNFEVVAPLVGGGIGHWYRDNNNPELPWAGPQVFATELGAVGAVSLVHSTLGDDLEVVARVGETLVHYWRQSGAWHGPVHFFTGATGAPAFIQSGHGGIGDFQVVTPLVAGGMAHLSRDNDAPGRPWRAPTTFGSGVVTSTSLLHSVLLQGARSLEVAARTGTATHIWYREDVPGASWQFAAVAPGDTVADPVTMGQWRVPFSSGVVGVHAGLLHTGRVLFFTYHEPWETMSHVGTSAVVDPRTGERSGHLPHTRDLFCGGQSFLPDGRLLVAGGTHFTTGLKSVYTFTPEGADGRWDLIGEMPTGRWYPTCTALPDGRALILGGRHWASLDEDFNNDTYQVFDPITNQIGPPVTVPLLTDAGITNGLYPFVFVLPDDRLLMHAGATTHLYSLPGLTHDGTQLTAVRPTSRTYPVEGTCVLLPLLPDSNPPYRARVMAIGGGAVPQALDAPATNTTEILDFGAGALAWAEGPPMAEGRVMPDSVLLPDGTVFVTNGSSSGFADMGAAPVYTPELFDPTAGTWTSLCPMRIPRLYHATALLLPDGRVLTAGTDGEFNPHPFHTSNYRVEVFSPPYLFRGMRPRILGHQRDVGYGEPILVETLDAGAVASACLIRNAAVTHSFNHDQRLVGLVITSRSPTLLTVEAPPRANLAPPGWYMLFLVSHDGVPSEGSFVRIRV
jgi:hypothetical protein